MNILSSASSPWLERLPRVASKTANPVTGGQAWTVLLMNNCGCGGFENTTTPLMMTSVKDRG